MAPQVWQLLVDRHSWKPLSFVQTCPVCKKTLSHLLARRCCNRLELERLSRHHLEVVLLLLPVYDRALGAVFAVPILLLSPVDGRHPCRLCSISLIVLGAASNHGCSRNLPSVQYLYCHYGCLKTATPDAVAPDYPFHFVAPLFFQRTKRQVLLRRAHHRLQSASRIEARRQVLAHFPAPIYGVLRPQASTNFWEGKQTWVRRETTNKAATT